MTYNVFGGTLNLTLHSTAPRYLSGQLRYVADLPSRHRSPVVLTSARHNLLLSAIVHLLLLACVSGTVYLLTSSLLRHSQHFFRN